jgi:hypothetical protein
VNESEQIFHLGGASTSQGREREASVFLRRMFLKVGAQLVKTGIANPEPSAVFIRGGSIDKGAIILTI